jgi:hypothetical protein
LRPRTGEFAGIEVLTVYKNSFKGKRFLNGGAVQQQLFGRGFYCNSAQVASLLGWFRLSRIVLMGA